MHWKLLFGWKWPFLDEKLILTKIFNSKFDVKNDIFGQKFPFFNTKSISYLKPCSLCLNMTRLTIQGSLDRVTTGYWWPKFQISRNFYCFSVLTRSVSLRCNFSCEYLQLREKKFWEKREDFCWFLFGVVDEEVFFESDTTTSRDPTRWAGDAEMRV